MKKDLKDFIRYITSIGKIDDSRLQWIDLAKGIAITMIVFRHTITGVWDAGIEMDPQFYEVCVQVGLTFRMPLYFLLSGIFFYRSISKRGQWGYTVHKANTIMYPYFIWSIILMTLQLIFHEYVNGQFTTLEAWLTVFYDPWGHWWFLYALFVVSILYMFLHKLVLGNKIALFFITVVFYFISHHMGDLYLVDDILELLVYFALGDIVSGFAVRLEESGIPGNNLFVTVMVLLAILGEYLLFYNFRTDPTANLVFAIIGISTASLLCVRIARSSRKWKLYLRLLGQHSLYIYLLHAFAAPAMRVFLNRLLGIESLSIIIPLSFLSGLIIPILVYRVINYFGGSFLFVPKFNSPVFKKDSSS